MTKNYDVQRNTFLQNLKFSHIVSIIIQKQYKMFCFKLHPNFQKRIEKDISNSHRYVIFLYFEMTVGFSGYILLQTNFYCLLTSLYANKELRRTCRSNGQIPLAGFGFSLDKKKICIQDHDQAQCTCIKPLKAKLDRKERKRF